MERELGGDPVVPAQVEELLENTAQPMVDGSSTLQHLFMMIGYGTTNAFGLDGDEGIDAFYAGGYLYAASLARLTSLTEIPLHDSVYEKIVDTDNVDFTERAYNSLLIQQAPFVNIIAKVERMFELDPQRSKIAVAGAGALHIVTKESMVVELTSIGVSAIDGLGEIGNALFEMNHPELKELDWQFDSLLRDDEA